jgi:hypothetical protein
MLQVTKPAQADRERFVLHPSVNMWRTLKPKPPGDTDSPINYIQSTLQVIIPS